MEYLSITLLSILCYWPGVFAQEFVFDDREAVRFNRFILWTDLRGNNGKMLNEKKVNSLWELWISDFWGNLSRSNTSHKSYRPLTTITFMIEAYLFGLEIIQIQRFTNILLHAFASILIYKLLCQFSILFCHKSYRIIKNKMTFLKHKPESDFCSIELLTTIYFIIHPIHTEVVCSLVGRAEILMTIFATLALLQYVNFLAMSTNSFNQFFLTKFIFKFTFFTICSILCKEQGFMIFPTCVVLYFCQQNFSLNSFKYLMLTMFAECFILFLIRHYINGFQCPKFSIIDNPIIYIPQLHFRLLNYAYIWFYNLYLLINPNNLCFDYSSGSIKLIDSLIDKKVYLMSLLCITIFYFGFLLFKSEFKAKRKILFFIFFGVISFLPSSNLLVTVGFTVAERTLYMPSLAFCALITFCVNEVRKMCQNIYTIFQLIFPILAILMIRKCIQRSYDWNSQMSLYSAGVTIFPDNAKIYYNLAKVFSNQGLFDKAKKNYQKVLSLNPHHTYALNNLALIIEREGELIKAEHLLQNAVIINNSFATAWMNLGIVQMSRGNLHNAKESFHKSLKLRANNADCLFNLGNLSLKMKERKIAQSFWKNSTLISPTHKSAWLNLFISYDNDKLEGKFEFDANYLIKTADEALLSNPTLLDLYLKIGILFAKFESLSKKSEFYLQKAIQLDTKNPNSWMNLGIYYHRRGSFAKAAKAYQNALKADPKNVNIKKNLSKVLPQSLT